MTGAGDCHSEANHCPNDPTISTPGDPEFLAPPPPPEHGPPPPSIYLDHLTTTLSPAAAVFDHPNRRGTAKQPNSNPISSHAHNMFSTGRIQNQPFFLQKHVLLAPTNRPIHPGRQPANRDHPAFFFPEFPLSTGAEHKHSNAETCVQPQCRDLRFPSSRTTG